MIADTEHVNLNLVPEEAVSRLESFQNKDPVFPSTEPASLILSVPIFPIFRPCLCWNFDRNKHNVRLLRFAEPRLIESEVAKYLLIPLRQRAT